MRISVIVPSYNHARFIGSTLESVLTQDHHDTEVLVHDGASSDGTISILQSYADKIDFVSEKDAGQADAINKGLQRATGEILAYLNSDDIYYPYTLKTVVEYFASHPDCLALYGDAYHLRVDGSIMEPYYTERWSYPRLLQICYLCQPAVFWRREVMERFGLFDATLHYALDYDYWLRVGREVEFRYLEGMYLAGSRLHEDTKTLKQRVAVHREILQVASRYAEVAPHNWLMNLAAVTVEAEQRRRGNSELDPCIRHCLFVKAVLDNADAEGIPLEAQVFEHLEQLLR
jgi:glycosyltransferase involved in cell wall biosynthesis